MSYVLILTSNWTNQPPAVIGGYETLESARRAGDAAIYCSTDERDPAPHYANFTVIPGAGEIAPARSVFSTVVYDIDYGAPEGERRIVWKKTVQGSADETMTTQERTETVVVPNLNSNPVHISTDIPPK